MVVGCDALLPNVPKLYIFTETFLYTFPVSSLVPRLPLRAWVRGYPVRWSIIIMSVYFLVTELFVYWFVYSDINDNWLIFLLLCAAWVGIQSLMPVFLISLCWWKRPEISRHSSKSGYQAAYIEHHSCRAPVGIVNYSVERCAVICRQTHHRLWSRLWLLSSLCIPIVFMLTTSLRLERASWDKQQRKETRIQQTILP